MKIYLAGSVPKGNEEAKTFDDWRKRYQEVLANVFPEAQFIDPYATRPDESDSMMVTGMDCGHIRECDLVIVYAEAQLGVGTSQELVIAKYFAKPVLTVLPKDTFHRRSNVIFHDIRVADWIHPFIDTFSNAVVEAVQDIASAKEKVLKTPKDITIIDQAITYAANKRAGS